MGPTGAERDAAAFFADGTIDHVNFRVIGVQWWTHKVWLELCHTVRHGVDARRGEQVEVTGQIPLPIRAVWPETGTVRSPASTPKNAVRRRSVHGACLRCGKREGQTAASHSRGRKKPLQVRGDWTCEIVVRPIAVVRGGVPVGS